MAQQMIDTTTNNGSYTGDPAKTAFGKVNANFTECYTNISSAASAASAAQTTANSAAATAGAAYPKSGGYLNTDAFVRTKSANSGQWAFSAEVTLTGGANGASNRGGLIRSELTNRYTTAGTPYQMFTCVEEIVGSYVQINFGLYSTSWSSFYLRQDGSAYCSGSWVGGSDARIKTDLVPIPDALTKVGKLTGYTGKKLGNPMASIIAQDFQAQIPEGVMVIGDVPLNDGSGTIITNTLGVDPMAPIALLVQAIKELKALVDAQAQKITALEALQPSSASADSGS